MAADYNYDNDGGGGSDGNSDGEEHHDVPPSQPPKEIKVENESKQTFFTYICKSWDWDDIPRDVTRIKVHTSVKAIQDNAFW